jgi:hypothetical protein
MTATWTAPKTWSIGELVTAALLNTHMRDNLEWLYARRMDILHYQDQKASGTNGATITSGAWRTRELNTEVVDTGGFGSVASNQVTLASGIYLAFFVLQIGNGGNRGRLRNVTDSTNLVDGTTMGPTAGNAGPSIGLGRFSLAATKTLELQQWSGTTVQAGLAISTGDVEVYADLLLARIGD